MNRKSFKLRKEFVKSLENFFKTIQTEFELKGGGLTLDALTKKYLELPLIMAKLEPHNPIKLNVDFVWENQLSIDPLEYTYTKAWMTYKIIEGAANNMLPPPVIKY